MAVKDKGESDDKDPKARDDSPRSKPATPSRGGIERSKAVPKVSEESNEEDTETAIETPFARDRGSPDEESEPTETAIASPAARNRAAGKGAGKSAASEKDSKMPKIEGKSKSERPETDSPVWLAPLFLGSLVLVFLGERVLATDETIRPVATGLGVVGAIGATLLRFRTVFSASGERRRTERILGFLMLGGLIALALYFATTETGRQWLGIAAAKPETRARIVGALTVGWIVAMLASAVPLLFGEIALAPMRRASFPESRRVRAAVIAGSTLAFAATYAALFTYATGEMEWKADFSYYRTSRPSESTKNVAKNLPEPIEVIAFFPRVNDIGSEVADYLNELKGAASQMTVRREDRLLEPALAKDLKVTADGVIVLRRGGQKEQVVVGADKNAKTKLKNLDQEFQKALLKVMRTQRTAYFTVGHGEMNEASGATAAEGRSAKGLKKLFESQNYAVKDLSAATGLGTDVPQDATIVVVLGPAQAMLAEEIGALQRYAAKGGALLVALDPEGKGDLAPLAQIFDLTYQPAILANDKVYLKRRSNDSDRTILVTARFSSHASVATLSRAGNKAPVVFQNAASIDKAQGTATKIDFAVKALPETFADPNGNFTLDPDEKRAAYNLVAAITKPGGTTEDGKEGEMRAFVLADADPLSDVLLQNEPNLVLALDAIRWLGKDESFAGSVTTNEDVRIEHTKQKDMVWFYGTILAAPGIPLALGFWITRRRKQKAAPSRRPIVDEPPSPEDDKDGDDAEEEEENDEKGSAS